MKKEKSKVLLIIGDNFKLAETLELHCRFLGFSLSDIIISSQAAVVNSNYAVFTKLMPTHVIILECDVRSNRQGKGIETWERIKSLRSKNQIIIPCGYFPVNDKKSLKLPYNRNDLKSKLEV